MTIDFGIWFLFAELWRGDDLGDRGLHSNGRRPSNRFQRSAGRAPRLLRWYE